MNTNSQNHRSIFARIKGTNIQRGLAWGSIIIGALVAFEVFNYSTTQFALQDVLGDLKFAGFRWATILAFAFCSIDFAGIARLFTPEKGKDEQGEAWYLFGAWLLAAAMNATLTWWGVAIAITSHSNLSSEVISTTTLTKVVPVFVAIMVLLIRVLLIGTFSAKGGKLFSQGEYRTTFQRSDVFRPVATHHPQPQPASMAAYRPGTKVSRSEPAFQNLPLQSKAGREAEYIDAPRAS
jgi:hypothetical protein